MTNASTTVLFYSPYKVWGNVIAIKKESEYKVFKRKGYVCAPTGGCSTTTIDSKC